MPVRAIVNCRLIDGTGAAPIESSTVIIDDDVIAVVGDREAVAVPPGAESIEAGGRTVIPGLIDGHMHVTGMPAFLDARGHLTHNLRAVGKLRHCLEWGTTTVLNVSGCPENVVLREAIDSGEITGCARMLVGAMVNPTGGHVRGRAADGPWEIRKAVREMVVAAVDLIKTSSSGGFQWEHEELGQPDYTLDELSALVDEAHMRGKLVTVHAHAQPGLGLAIEAGCDIICHGAAIDDAGLERIAARGPSFMPTLFITSEKSFSVPSRPEYMRERMKATHPVHRAGVRKAHEMGIKISTGTDGGPGALMLELVELVNCGLSPMDAIVAATRNTAEALGLSDLLGTIQPGRKADLVMLGVDPLDSIDGLLHPASILLVMRDGRVESAAEALKQYWHRGPRSAH